MLKRYQVVFNTWLADHLKGISKKYDISFSEALRLVACVQVPKLISAAYPKYKPVDLEKDFVKMIKKYSRAKGGRSDLHRLFSDVYFEARKAVEFWENEEKKRKKKKTCQ